MQTKVSLYQGNRLRNNREQKTRKNGFYSTKFGEDRHATLAMTERRSHYQHLNRVTARNEAVLLSVSDCPAVYTAIHFKQSPPGNHDAEGDKLFSQYIKDKTGSDFVFITKYPTAKRPFYAMHELTQQANLLTL